MKDKKKESVKSRRAEIEKSPLNKIENQKFSDQIPLVDLTIETEQEKDKK